MVSPAETFGSLEPRGGAEFRPLDEVISDALAVVDGGLRDLLHRELVSTNEVADLLLDVRTLLAPSQTIGEAASIEPVGTSQL